MNIIEMCGNQKPRNTELVDYCIEFLHHELQKFKKAIFSLDIFSVV